MRDLKFRYILENEEGNICGHEIYTLAQIERGECTWITLKSQQYKVKSRDQFTGLKDKNGVEIFEGDIIYNPENFGCHTSWGDASDDHPYHRVVIWDEDIAGFRLAFMQENIRDRGVSGYSLVKRNNNVLEVVGNIHSNPELLPR